MIDGAATVEQHGDLFVVTWNGRTRIHRHTEQRQWPNDPWPRATLVTRELVEDRDGRPGRTGV